MQRRRFEKVAVVLLSIAMLLTSTGIVSSLAVNVSESSAAPENSSTSVSTSVSTSTSTSSTVTQEGGSVTSSTVVEDGGTVTVDNGDGTKENPYKISTAEDFLAIGDKVNDTSSADKHFVLTNDIDLSGITAKDFENGSLVGIDRTLATKSANVFVILDGNGYALKGLKVELTKGSEASVFGYLNEKSTVKNIKLDRPAIKSTSDDMSRVAFVAAENKGTVSGIEITYPVLTVEKADYSAFAVAVNYGTLTDISVRASHTNISAATADNHTISSAGTVGAVAGLNHGTITNASAINVGMFIPEIETAVIYGGIAGANSGSVLNSVSTGNVMGGKASDVVGGVVGKAVAPVGGDEAASTLTNNYTLVAISKTASGCGVIGSAGKAEMLKDCYWSSAVSGKDVAATDFGAGVNELNSRPFVILPEGKKVTLTASDVKATVFGKANAELDGEFAVKGDGVKAQASDGKAEIIAETAGKTAYATYTAKIMLPANVGAAGANSTLKQYMRVYILTASKDAEGDGTALKPFVIKTLGDFAMFRNAPSMNAVLGADITVSSTIPAIKGTFDGNGYTIKAKASIASDIYGTFRNVNINITANLNSAVLGNAIGADVSGVAVAMADGVKLTAQAGNRGILFNRIGGESVIDDCHAQGEILIGADKLSSIGAFAGLVNGKSKITNSGAVADITLGEGFTAEKTANFIGSVTADDVTVSSCYVGGANPAGKSVLIADMPEKIKVENIVTGWSFDGGNVGFFTGNGGKFTATLPAIKAFTAAASDYEVICDTSKVTASVSVAGGKLTLSVERAKGVVTLKALPVSVVNKKTGLSATINVSNGLEKDAQGRYIISTAYDLAYLSENVAELYNADFIMTADVDMSDLSSFAPIGTTDVAFSGTFDGNGKTVRNLTIDGTAKVGLFAVLNGATVKNIKFAKADISATGGYAAVLAGQIIGNTTVSGITVDGAKVESRDLYAGIIVGAVDSVDADVSIKDVTVNNSTINSESNYVGAVAGRVNGKATIGNAAINSFKANGASYVSGAVGLAIGEATLEAVTVSGATLSGVSEVSGIASGNGDVTIRTAVVKGSDISTLAITSANTAAGISAVFGSAIEGATVENTVVTAGVAGGIVGKTISDGTLIIKNAEVKSSKINSQDANTVAAGILGVHNVKGKAVIDGASVDENTVISGAAVSAGLVGDCSGADSVLEVTGAKTLATVNGSMTANAIAAAGALGRIGTSAINNVKLSDLKVGGTVSGMATVGGIIGIIKSGEKYDGASRVVDSTVVFAQINNADSLSSGIIVGAVEGDIFGSYGILAFGNIVLSTYCGVDVYPTDKLSGGYTDMNSGISVSENTLKTTDETTVSVFGLPTVDGYSFDAESGWSSESADRIQVVSSKENEVVLKAEHRAQVRMVAYYVFDADAQVRIPVSFEVTSNVYEPLSGSGTQADPYLVNNAYELESVSQYADKGAYFALAQDIVITDADYDFGGAFYNLGNGIVSIGSADKPFNGVFTGLYNGKVHSISGLRMSGAAIGGIFAVTDGATVSDLVINGADISATVSAGILSGRAVDSVYRNIVINSSSVKATGLGGAVGAVTGVAESTTVENVTVNTVQVSTTDESTGATVEVAGGIAGTFSGTLKDVNVSSLKLSSDTIGAGLIGIAHSGTYISSASVDAQVNAEIAGGVIGEARDSMYISIDGVSAAGEVNGAEISAGVIAKLTSADPEKTFDKLNKSLVSDTVVTAKVDGNGVKAIVIGDVSEKIAVDKENTDTDVFSNVYYSSYSNALGAFGQEQFNTYQNDEYTITDLSDMRYSVNGEAYDSVKLSTEFTVLSDDSVVMNVDGSYRSFTAGGKTFNLNAVKSDVDGLVEHDAQNNAVRLTQIPSSPAKLVFVYNDGLETAIDISADYAGVVEDAVSVSFSMVNASSDKSLSDKLIGVMLKTKADGQAKSSDFFAEVDAQPSSIGAIDVQDGNLYVNMHLPQGYKFSINATDENSQQLTTQDAGNEGVLVAVGEAKSVTVTVTVEDNTDTPWGLRSLWSVIGK